VPWFLLPRKYLDSTLLAVVFDPPLVYTDLFAKSNKLVEVFSMRPVCSKKKMIEAQKRKSEKGKRK
jgi:hypothetical protein